MKYFQPFLIITLFLSLSCSESNDSSDNLEEMTAELAILENEKLAIEELAVSVPCTDDTTCSYTPFGSKPCGGPWSYLAYNSEIGEDLFLARVQSYFEAEQAFNLKWGIISDCSVPAPPYEVTCVNGVCTAVYQ